MPKKKRSELGLTLIEIIVGLTIIGVIVALSVGGIRSAFDADLKKTASRLSSTLRYLSNKAVTDHVYLRITFDLNEGSYRVEQTSDPFVISPEEEGSEGDGKETPKEKGEDGKAEGEKDGAFTPAESGLLKPVKFPSGVSFKDVSVSYLSHKRENGSVATYFFPDGYATPTIINLRNKDDDAHFSVELFALSGRVKVTDEYKESFEGKDEK